MNDRDTLTLIRRGVVEVISEADLKHKLALKRPLVIKAGFDPTAPDLHLGHTVLLRKLADFLRVGHKVIFLIGDATALIGDPSGQSKMRKLMTPEEVESNAETYYLQVKKVLKVAGITDNLIGMLERKRNSEWFGGTHPFGLTELVELTSRYTVARLIERDDFQKRMKAGQEVSMLELLYPLMQGYDSVMMKADVELGGTDQKFNLLVGRDLQRSYGQEPQVVMTMPLLEGTDGVQKMSKSLGNQISINEPADQMFGKVMSIPDGLILKYLTLLTDVETGRIEELDQQLKARAINPRDAKANLAATLVEMYHGKPAAEAANAEFFKVFSRRETPSDMPEVTVTVSPDGAGVNLIDLLVAQGLAKSNNDARRLMTQGAVKLNGSPVKQPVVPVAQAAGVLQVGPRHFRKLVR